MGLVQYAMVGNYKRFYNKLKDVGKQIDKNPFILFLDTACCTLVCGSGLSDYLNYRFYEKNWKKRREYATIGYQDKFYKKAARDVGGEYFYNKLNFHEKFKDFTNLDFYNPKNGIDEMKKFLKKHQVCMVKPVIGLAGSEVERIKTSEIKDFEEFYNKLVDKKLFLEQYAVQNKDWGKISPNSVNTLRVVTSAVNGKSRIFFVAARIGNGTAVVDNFHQGGTASLVDYEKGVLVGNGINKNLDEFEKHPVTGIKFDGYKIPFWEEVKDMCLKAALVNDNVHVVGWDVAITEDGPILIEGNNGPGFDIVQVLEKRGTKYMLEDIKKELKEANLW